jgi:3-oxoacyl-[acyl-carrier protein] reductase
LILQYGSRSRLGRPWYEILGPRGFRINCIAPGVIGTDMSPRLADLSVVEAVLARQALKRIGEPQAIADAVAMLMAADARWMTGLWSLFRAGPSCNTVNACAIGR